MPANTKHLDAFDKDKLKFITPIKREQENMGRFHLEKDAEYLIVCALENFRFRNEFHLSLYFDCALRDVYVKRVFHPDDKM